ncbi:unnamed protein product [Dovyalis caffra]|uniref:Uncharacterized protein n=1 Tax=Dovyalis caffra TaxID=77055 RepID=A0AAV1RLU7_9ROSI|nr:unnamed protein product [Dovyalis caffra]
MVLLWLLWYRRNQQSHGGSFVAEKDLSVKARLLTDEFEEVQVQQRAQAQNGARSNNVGGARWSFPPSGITEIIDQSSPVRLVVSSRFALAKFDRNSSPP